MNTSRDIPLNLTLFGIIFALAATLVAWLWFFLGEPDPVWAIALGAVVCLLIAGLVLTRGPVWPVLVQMSPTALLMTVFPLIVGTLGDTIFLVLMVSITVPWISHAVTLPFYRPLQDVDRGDAPVFHRAFCQVWPALIAASLLSVALFTVIMTSLTHWARADIGLYVLGLVTNLLFAQSLIPAQETRRYSWIFAGWFFYAVTLLLVPHLWFLAPLAGILPQLLLLGRGLAGLVTPWRLSFPPLLKETIIGLSLGSVLWADKFFLIALNLNRVDIITVYVGLIPVVVAIAFYFTSQYPVLRASLDSLLSGINSAPIATLDSSGSRTRRQVWTTMAVTVLVSAGTSLGVILVSGGMLLTHSPFSLMLFLVPTVLLGLHLALYQLTQFQLSERAAFLGGIHLVATVYAFALTDPEFAYMIVLVSALAVTVAALKWTADSVADVPYEQFWQKAVAW